MKKSVDLNFNFGWHELGRSLYEKISRIRWRSRTRMPYGANFFILFYFNSHLILSISPRKFHLSLFNFPFLLLFAAASARAVGWWNDWIWIIFCGSLRVLCYKILDNFVSFYWKILDSKSKFYFSCLFFKSVHPLILK